MSFLSSIIPVPVIQQKSKSFQDKMAVEILSKIQRIKYITRLMEIIMQQRENWKLYTEPLSINETTEIQAKGQQRKSK
jgi:hypothetical protein